MKPEKTTTTNPSNSKVAAAFRSIGNGLAEAGRYAAYLSLVLIGIWFTGRVLEALFHRVVFEPPLVFWLTISIWILLGIFLLSRLILNLKQLTAQSGKASLMMSWIFFGFLVAATMFVLRGYQIASAGLYSTMAGLSEPARESFIMMFQVHPVTPILPVNVAIAKLTGIGIEVDSVMAFVWPLPYIFIFFLWSFVYGTLLLMIGKIRLSKMINLMMVLAGLVITMVFKTAVTPSNEQLVFLHAAAVAMLVFQLILTHSYLVEAAESLKGKSTEEKNLPLPPSGLQFTLVILFVLPILADLHNQFGTTSPTASVVTRSEKKDIKDTKPAPAIENKKTVSATNVKRSGAIAITARCVKSYDQPTPGQLEKSTDQLISRFAYSKGLNQFE